MDEGASFACFLSTTRLTKLENTRHTVAFQCPHCEYMYYKAMFPNFWLIATFLTFLEIEKIIQTHCRAFQLPSISHIYGTEQLC